MPTAQQEEKWQKADDEVRKNLPPGVKLVRTLRELTENIYCIAWSPDGRMLAAPSRDRTIRLWDADTGECLRTLAGHAGKVYSVAFDPTGRTLASGSSDNTVKLWEPAGSHLLQTLHGHKNDVRSVAFDPTGRTLASGSVDHTVKLWEPAGGHLLRTLNGHEDWVRSVAFDPTGGTLASGSDDNTVKLWEPAGDQLLRTLTGHTDMVYSVDFDPTGRTLISGSFDNTVKIWSSTDGRLIRTLEAHTAAVFSVMFLAEGRLIASQGADNTVRLSNTETGACLAVVSWTSGGGIHSLACHPRRPLLAVVGSDPGTPKEERERLIHIYELDYVILLGQPAVPAVNYTSAKIVLVGDSGVGKTGLGWRLAHGHFKDHPSTHGQQFWLLDALCKQRKDGARCEAILWDLAGQPDYRLIHALFLDDADLALILFDPTHHDDPLSGVEFWLKQLKACKKDGAGTPTVLIASRKDRGMPRLTAKELEAFCQRHGIKFYLPTSAKENEGITELIEGMKNLIPWEDKPATVTTETFKRIKDFVLGLKENRRRRKVILTPEELRARLTKSDKKWMFSDAEMLTAVGHLANHGYVTWLKTSKGEPRVLLAPELLNNLAASFVLEARGNSLGLGVLEEQRLLAGGYKFPELAKLDAAEKDILVDSATVLFLQHNVCFRETDPLNSRLYLVFPELINLKKPTDGDDGPTEDGPAYTASGSVENVYSSLVVLLRYTQTFTRMDQWQNQARYEVGPEGFVCGFRQEAERPGELDFSLYFGANTPGHVRALFQSLFESFLSRRHLTVLRFDPIVCPNGHAFDRGVAQKQIAKGAKNAFCAECGEKVSLAKTNQSLHLAAGVTPGRRVVERRSRFEQTLFLLKTHVTKEKIPAPQCFISYAWGDPDHEHWVEKLLATDLQNAGINVLLDKWHNRKFGSSIARFVEQIEECDRLIVVGTPSYRQKAKNAASPKGSILAAHWDMAGIRMIATEAEKKTVIPLLLSGNESEAFPALLRGRVPADFRDSENYFATALELLLDLYEIGHNDAVAKELREVVDGDKTRR